jgi:hypothetical protein
MRLVLDGPSSAVTPWEAVALGRSFARAGLMPRARAAFEHAAATSAGRSVMAQASRLEALRALALLLRRERRFDDAAACWRLVLEMPACPLLLAREANEALAIHHEHRVRDLDAARTFALRSLGNGNDRMRNGSGWNDAVRHRLQRIERKMTPVNGRSLFPSSSPERLSFGSPTSGPRTSS